MADESTLFRYFTCAHDYGIFVPATVLHRAPTLRELDAFWTQQEHERKMKADSELVALPSPDAGEDMEAEEKQPEPEETGGTTGSTAGGTAGGTRQPAAAAEGEDSDDDDVFHSVADDYGPGAVEADGPRDGPPDGDAQEESVALDVIDEDESKAPDVDREEEQKVPRMQSERPSFWSWMWSQGDTQGDTAEGAGEGDQEGANEAEQQEEDAADDAGAKDEDEDAAAAGPGEAPSAAAAVAVAVADDSSDSSSESESDDDFYSVNPTLSEVAQAYDSLQHQQQEEQQLREMIAKDKAESNEVELTPLSGPAVPPSPSTEQQDSLWLSDVGRGR